MYNTPTSILLNGRGVSQLVEAEVVPEPAVKEPKGEKPAWMKSAVILHANGLSLMDVALSLGKNPKNVSDVLLSDWGKAEMLRCRNEFDVGALEQEQLKACAREAVMVIQTLMHTAQSEKTRFDAAKEILNRTLGVPTQKVQQSTTLISMDSQEEIEKLKADLKLNLNV